MCPIDRNNPHERVAVAPGDALKEQWIPATVASAVSLLVWAFVREEGNGLDSCDGVGSSGAESTWRTFVSIVESAWLVFDLI